MPASSIARFNNWNNLAFDSDRNAANGYKFVPGQAIPAKNGLPGFSASQTMNQMLSRRDFAAEVAHLRLRGADSFVAFEPGVVGYDNTQKRSDDVSSGFPCRAYSTSARNTAGTPKKRVGR